jgi:hypothetical protein
MFKRSAWKKQKNIVAPPSVTSENAEIRKLRSYQQVSGKFIGDIIRQDNIPWLSRAAGPSTWRAYGKPALPVYVLELDTTQVSASRLVNNRGLLHDIQTALGGKVNVEWKNHVGLGLIFDGRQLRFPDKIPLPPPPESNYLIPFGADIKGKQIWRSIRETKNVVVAGSSQYGKTTGFRTWLTALTAQHGPDELKLALVDGKDFELTPFFEGSPYLPDFMNGSVASSAQEVEAVTVKLVQEVIRRRQLFKQHRVGSTAALERKTGYRLPVIILVVDELKELIDSGLDATNLFRIAQQGVGLDMFITLGTQRPDAETVRKSNFATTVAYHLVNTTESQVVFTRHTPYYILEAADPGECVVLGPGMNYMHLKGFWTPKPGEEPAAEREQRVDTPADTRAVPPSRSLSKSDAILVRIAVLRNNGVCSVGKIFRLIQDNLPEKYWQKGGIYTEHRIRTKFAQWEEAGLLTRPSRLPDGRRQGRTVTDRLLQLAGMKTGA